MKKLLSVLFAFGFALGINASVFGMGIVCPPGLARQLGGADPPPFSEAFSSSVCVFGSVGVTTFDIPVFQDGKTFSIHAPGNPDQPFKTNGPGFSIEIRGIIDPDPSINFNILATNTSNNTNSDPKSFQIFILEEIVPQGFPNKVEGQLGILLTDGNGSGGVTIAPVSPPSGILTDGTDKIAVFSVSSDPLGSTPTSYKNMLVDVGPGGSTSVPIAFLFDESGELDGPDHGGPGWNFLRLDLGFTLSAGDTAQISGFGSINNVGNFNSVPEPGTLLLLGFGLVGLGFFRRRKKSS